MQAGSDNLKLRIDQLDTNQVGNGSKGGRRRGDESGQLHRTHPPSGFGGTLSKVVCLASALLARTRGGNVEDATVSKI